jgi:phosphatidylglycerophosphate synthase
VRAALASGRQAGHQLTDGERWAADALSALREDRFSVPAIARFLRDSFDRAAATSSRRDPLKRQARRWSAINVGLALAARGRLATRGGGDPSIHGLLACCALQAAMLDWHLGMVEGLEGQPRARLSAADALTLARSTLTLFAAAAPPDTRWFTILLALAGASDLLDGQLARSAGPTRLGRDFDTLADLAFRAGALRGAARAGWLPRAPARALLVRQVLLASGAAWHWFAHSERPPLDTTRLARWDAPPLLTGLALSAHGRRDVGGTLVVIGAGVGALGLVRAQRAPRVRT